MKKITKWFQPQQKKDIMVDIASMIAFILADMNITAKELGEKTFFESWYLSLVKHLNYKELSDIMVHKFAMSLKLVRPYFNWSFAYNWNKDHPDDPSSHYPDIPPFAPRIADICADSIKKYETLDAENDIDAKQKETLVEEEESNLNDGLLGQAIRNSDIGLLTEDIPFSEASQESINRLAEEQSMLNKTQSLFQDLADALSPVTTEQVLKEMQFNTSKHMPENKIKPSSEVKKPKYVIIDNLRTLRIELLKPEDTADITLVMDKDDKIENITIEIDEYGISIYLNSYKELLEFFKNMDIVNIVLMEFINDKKLT